MYLLYALHSTTLRSSYNYYEVTVTCGYMCVRIFITMHKNILRVAL